MARYVVSASAEGDEEHRGGHDFNAPVSHTNWRATATAFSAARRTLSATNQSQAASGLLRSGVMAPTAIPPWPACPTLVGGSKSPPRTSMDSMESELSSMSISGASTNSTQAEKL